MEGLVGASFCSNATSEEKANLRDKVKELYKYVDHPDNPDLLRLKNEFYAVLVEGARNEFAGAMLRQLNNRVTILRRISMAQAGRLHDTIKELEAIVAAIDAGEPEGSGKTMRAACTKVCAKFATHYISRIGGAPCFRAAAGTPGFEGQAAYGAKPLCSATTVAR